MAKIKFFQYLNTLLF